MRSPNQRPRFVQSISQRPVLWIHATLLWPAKSSVRGLKKPQDRDDAYLKDFEARPENTDLKKEGNGAMNGAGSRPPRHAGCQRHHQNGLEP